MAVTADANWAWPIFDPKKSGPISASDPYWLVKLNYVGPARRNGEALLWIDAVNPLKQPRRAWQYLPGQRRVKLAPDLAYDTPNPGAAGAGTYDDVSVFNGAIDRYDWKLVGKKEMYVPYSSYRLTYHKTSADVTKPNHLNPDFVRWELHRVWVVEATLKADKRHIYSKRVFYLDEDSWTALASDQYDARGQLYRSSFAYPSYSYDAQAPFGDTFAIYDFSSGVYNITGLFGPYNGSQVHGRAAEGELLVVRGACRCGPSLTRSHQPSHATPGARRKPRRAGRGGSPSSNHDRFRMTMSALVLALAATLATPAIGAGFVDPLDAPADAIPARSAESDAGGGESRKPLVAVGQRGHVVYSTDSGASWKQASVPVSSDLTAVFFVDDKQGWAVGHDGVILHTARRR